MNLIFVLFKYLGYILFRPVWWLERLIPRNKKLWVFGAWYGQKYSDNSKWLFEYVLENEPQITVVWITKNKSVYEKLKKNAQKVCMSNSIAGIWYCLRASYSILTSGVVDVNRFFLNGCRQIWLWHGMPLKKILYCDDANMSVPVFRKTLSRIFNPYSQMKPYCTITSADFFTPFLMSAFKIPEHKIWKTGLPRCDAFFSNKKESLITELRQKFEKAKIFFYMPTFRMSSNLDGDAFSAFVENFGFDENEFSDFLEKQNIVFLFKPHFVDGGVKVKVDSQRFIYINDDDYDDLYILLNNVDALLTDYSSVYFDFLATKKNIYLLPFDYEAYIANSRSHFFDMYKEMNGIVCRDWKDYYRAVENNQKADLSTSIKFSNYLDGHSCKKITNMIKRNDSNI